MWNKIRHSLFLRLVILPSFCIFFIAWLITGKNDFAFIVSLSTAFVSWLNSQILSSLSFIRSEASKNRDSVAQYIEKLFDEMEVLFQNRDLKRDKLEEILAGRISVLEFRLRHIKERTKISFLNEQELAQLRDTPLDLLDAETYKEELIRMRLNYLEKIEENYSKWFKDKI